MGTNDSATLASYFLFKKYEDMISVKMGDEAYTRGGGGEVRVPLIGWFVGRSVHEGMHTLMVCAKETLMAARESWVKTCANTCPTPRGSTASVRPKDENT